MTQLFLSVFFVGLPAAFSEPPADVSTDKVIASGLRGGALVPTHGRGTAAHNREMLDAMQSWNAHDWATGVEKFRRIWQQSPDSPWAAEAELHEACYLKFNCRYDEAEERFLSILRKYPDSRGVCKKVFYYLPHLYATTGRLADAIEAQRMLGEFALNWQEQQFLENQLRVLSSTNKAQDDGRLCGMKALALAQAAAERGRPEEGLKDASYRNIFARRPWALERSSHPDGYSLAELTRKGGGAARRISYEDLRRLAKPGRPVIAYLDTPRPPKVYATLSRSIPADMPSLTGHFVVVERAQDGYLEALDPINGRERWDACMFQARWSGVVLLLPEVTGQQGQPLEDGLAETFRGGCCGNPPPDPCAGECCDAPAGGGASGPGGGLGGPGGGPIVPLGAGVGGCPTCGGGGSPSGGTCCEGAPGYRFGLATANLVVMDTPMWYPNANGPELRVHLVYNRINSGILSDTNPPPARYYSFGNKWSFNYNSFIRVPPNNNIEVVLPSGLVLAYQTNFIPLDIRNRHTLEVEGAYYRLTLDGSRMRYYYSTNTASQAGQQVERIADQFGQELTMQYNANGQLTNITDAVGRYFSLAYDGNGYVTNIADSIGRSCSFGYSASSNLVSMTDMGGYVTSLQYSNNNWVTNIVYPNNSVLHMTYENGYDMGWPYSEYDEQGFPAFRIRVIDSVNQTNEYI